MSALLRSIRAVAATRAVNVAHLRGVARFPALAPHRRAFADASPAAPAYLDLVEGTQTLDALVASRPRVLTYFTAAWCGPCRAIAPIFTALAKEHTGVTFVKIDIDANPDTAEKAGISAVPSFKTFVSGKSTGQFSGANAAALKSAAATLAAAQ